MAHSDGNSRKIQTLARLIKRSKVITIDEALNIPCDWSAYTVADIKEAMELLNSVDKVGNDQAFLKILGNHKKSIAIEERKEWLTCDEMMFEYDGHYNVSDINQMIHTPLTAWLCVSAEVNLEQGDVIGNGMTEIALQFIADDTLKALKAKVAYLAPMNASLQDLFIVSIKDVHQERHGYIKKVDPEIKRTIRGHHEIRLKARDYKKVIFDDKTNQFFKPAPSVESRIIKILNNLIRND